MATCALSEMESAPRQEDFMTESQIAAVQPVMNGTAGPQLVRDYSFPMPTYKTAFPILLTGGIEEVVVRFLVSKAGSLSVQLKNCNISASSSSVLEYVQPEVYETTLVVSPLGAGLGSTQIEINEAGRPVCYVIVQYEAEIGFSDNSMQQSAVMASPMEASIYGLEWRQSPVNNPTSSMHESNGATYLSQNRGSAEAPNFTPNRYHSRYCYDCSEVPAEVAERARLSNLAFSQSGSKTAEEPQDQKPYSVEEHLEEVEIPVKEMKHDSLEQGRDAEELISSSHEEGEEEEKEIDFEQTEELKPSDLTKESDEPADTKPKTEETDSPFRLLPSALLLPPTSRGLPESAIIRIKNTESAEITLELRIAARSFNTSSANCEFEEMSPGCAAFALKEEEFIIAPGEFKDIEVVFEPQELEYILHSAKLLITVSGKSYQVPLLGLAGNPDISAHGNADSKEIRLRNDGDGVGVVMGASESWILQPGASEVIESGEREFKVMHDGLRMLREPEWKEMIEVMGMTGIDEQIDRLIALTCIGINVEE